MDISLHIEALRSKQSACKYLKSAKTRVSLIFFFFFKLNLIDYCGGTPDNFRSKCFDLTKNITKQEMEMRAIVPYLIFRQQVL